MGWVGLVAVVIVAVGCTSKAGPAIHDDASPTADSGYIMEGTTGGDAADTFNIRDHVGSDAPAILMTPPDAATQAGGSQSKAQNTASIAPPKPAVRTAPPAKAKLSSGPKATPAATKPALTPGSAKPKATAATDGGKPAAATKPVPKPASKKP